MDSEVAAVIWDASILFFGFTHLFFIFFSGERTNDVTIILVVWPQGDLLNGGNIVIFGFTEVRQNVNRQPSAALDCDPYTRTGCTGTGVRSVRIEDDPIHTIYCLIPAVFICKLTTLLSIAPASTHLFPCPRSRSPQSQRPES